MSTIIEKLLPLRPMETYGYITLIESMPNVRRRNGGTYSLVRI